MGLDQYIEARDGLIEKDLVSFDGTLFQVLELPESIAETPNLTKPDASNRQNHGPQSLANVFRDALKNGSRD